MRPRALILETLANRAIAEINVYVEFAKSLRFSSHRMIQQVVLHALIISYVLCKRILGNNLSGCFCEIADRGTRDFFQNGSTIPNRTRCNSLLAYHPLGCNFPENDSVGFLTFFCSSICTVSVIQGLVFELQGFWRLLLFPVLLYSSFSRSYAALYR